MMEANKRDDPPPSPGERGERGGRVKSRDYKNYIFYVKMEYSLLGSKNIKKFITEEKDFLRLVFNYFKQTKKPQFKRRKLYNTFDSNTLLHFCEHYAYSVSH